jgi:hypothetical protein
MVKTIKFGLENLFEMPISEQLIIRGTGFLLAAGLIGGLILPPC